jgi:hypothetical protein
MEINKKVRQLTNFGLSKTTLSKLNESQINLLFEKYKKIKKEEPKEQVTKTTEPAKDIITIGVQGGDLPNNPTGKGYKIEKKPDGTTKATPMESEVTEDMAMDTLTGYNPYQMGGNLPDEYGKDPQSYGTDNSVDPDGKNDGMPTTESVIEEKFESKAQQGLFWARCNKCSDKKCKWCKMAKEFSDSTSKKQYKNMPEKKHPEKTVKNKKEKTNESEQKYWEKEIIKMVEENIIPKMTKKDLVNTIKKKTKKSDSMIISRPKKLTMFSDEAPMELPISKMFSIGKK